VDFENAISVLFIQVAYTTPLLATFRTGSYWYCFTFGHGQM